ncbi:MAG: PKD domain-containing protein [Candidatus Bipolaricaulota bacterium]|nr:PKD domain-containing protein [Candidatus Bipolaricaulota bacterium]
MKPWKFGMFALILALLPGCTQPIQIGEKPDRPPVAAISLECSACQGERSGVAPLALTLDASSSTDDYGIVLAHWKVSDGREFTGLQVELTLEKPGQYTIQLTIYDKAGQTATARTEITVLAPPPAEFRVERAESELVIVERVLPNRPLQVGETIQITLRVTAQHDLEYVYWREILPYALSSYEDLEFMLLRLPAGSSHEWVYTVTVEQSGSSKLEGRGQAAYLAHSTELTLSTVLEVP